MDQKRMEQRKMEKRGFACVGLGLGMMALLCMEAAVLVVERAVYGTFPETLMQNCIHWTLTCLLWGCGIRGAYRLVVRKGLIGEGTAGKVSTGKAALPEEGERAAMTGRQWLLLFGIIAAGILVMTASWDMSFRPCTEFANLSRRFGGSGAGAVAIVFQYLYYMAESALILSLVVLGQQAGESFFHAGKKSWIPWGGVFCAITWGLPHLVSKDLGTAVLSAGISLLFCLAYQAAGRRLAVSFLAIAVIFIV